MLVYRKILKHDRKYTLYRYFFQFYMNSVLFRRMLSSSCELICTVYFRTRLLTASVPYWKSMVMQMDSIETLPIPVALIEEISNTFFWVWLLFGIFFTLCGWKGTLFETLDCSTGSQMEMWVHDAYLCQTYWHRAKVFRVVSCWSKFKNPSINL